MPRLLVLLLTLLPVLGWVESAHATEQIDLVAVLSRGDLYVIDVQTGEPTRLTQDGYAGLPRWSADGTTLFFSDGGYDQPQAFRWTAHGGVQPLPGSPAIQGVDGARSTRTDCGASACSPDAPSRVVATVNGRGGPITPLESGWRWLPLGWSPDGSTLALQRAPTVPVPLPKNAPSPPATTLWLTQGDPLRGRLRELPMPPSFNGMPGIVDTVAWSPSGRYLVVGVGPLLPCNSCRADGLPYYALPIDGGAPIALGTALGDPPFSWGPGDHFLVISAPLGRAPADPKHLTRVDLPSGAQRELAADPDAVDVEPAVSPDGATIASTRGLAAPLATGGDPQLKSLASRRIWLIGDGVKPRPLIDHDDWAEGAPAWTADGNWIVYVRWDPGHGSVPPSSIQLWRAAPDGSRASELIDGLGQAGSDTYANGYNGRFGTFFAVQPPTTGMGASGSGGHVAAPIRQFVSASAVLVLLALAALAEARRQPARSAMARRS